MASVRKSLSNFSPGESFEYVARTLCTTYLTRGSSQNFAVSPPESAAMTLASEGGRVRVGFGFDDTDDNQGNSFVRVWGVLIFKRLCLDACFTWRYELLLRICGLINNATAYPTTNQYSSISRCFVTMFATFFFTCRT